MTKKRKKLLELILHEKKPLNASQLCSLMQNSVDQSTVYRALQYLEQHSYLGSFIYECKLRGVERYYYSSGSLHAHYMHCENCHKFIPFNNCPIYGAIENIEKEYGFKVEHHSITMSGVCHECTIKEVK